jgi:hypothetical protein
MCKRTAGPHYSARMQETAQHPGGNTPTDDPSRLIKPSLSSEEMKGDRIAHQESTPDIPSPHEVVAPDVPNPVHPDTTAATISTTSGPDAEQVENP